MRRAVALLAVALCALAAGCGDPGQLSRADGERLERSRDRIESALATEARLHTAPAAARRIVGRVREIVSDGALEARQLDEFGLAALGELRLVVPSVVLVDSREVPRELDRAALATFLARAESDPTAALRRPIAVEVRRIADTLADAEAGADTEIPVVGRTVGDFLSRLQSSLAERYPDLADRVAAIRADV